MKTSTTSTKAGISSSKSKKSASMSVLVDAEEYSKLTKEKHALERERNLLKKQVAALTSRTDELSATAQETFQMQLMLHSLTTRYETLLKKYEDETAGRMQLLGEGKAMTTTTSPGRESAEQKEEEATTSVQRTQDQATQTTCTSEDKGLPSVEYLQTKKSKSVLATPLQESMDEDSEDYFLQAHQNHEVEGLAGEGLADIRGGDSILEAEQAGERRAEEGEVEKQDAQHYPEKDDKNENKILPTERMEQEGGQAPTHSRSIAAPSSSCHTGGALASSSSSSSSSASCSSLALEASASSLGALVQEFSIATPDSAASPQESSYSVSLSEVDILKQKDREIAELKKELRKILEGKGLDVEKLLASASSTSNGADLQYGSMMAGGASSSSCSSASSSPTKVLGGLSKPGIPGSLGFSGSGSSSSSTPHQSSTTSSSSDFLYISKIRELEDTIQHLKKSQSQRGIAERLIANYFTESVTCGFAPFGGPLAGAAGVSSSGGLGGSSRNSTQMLVETILRENVRLQDELGSRRNNRRTAYASVEDESDYD
ncbi:unnamed protein product [Amoebophrya sp. A25]|nr:unnamed protein product [Amoebophrya sp. A25]|eukprot:GSA25T00001403001.1